MPIIQPRYASPGLVRQDGSVEGPLGNLLRSLVAAANSAPTTVNISDLQTRLAALESGGTSWNGHGLNGIAVSGNSGSGYIFTLTATTTNIPEGTNLYYTAARARADVIAATITNGDVTHSPSGDAVFDALALKMDAPGNQSANTVWAGPVTGSPGAVTFRALVNADIPTALTGKTYNGLSVAHNGAGTFTIEEPFALHLLTVSDTTTLNGGTMNGGTHSGTNTGDQVGYTAGSASVGNWVLYNGTTQAAGKWDGGTTAPAHTTRLNYDGYLYATKFFGDGSGLTGVGGSTPTGTGFRHVTAGVEDGASVTIDGISAASGGDVKVIAPATHAATSKTTPVDADEFTGTDSASSYGLVRFTWANIKAGFWSALGALIAAGTGKTTMVDADSFAICDSAASNATKALTLANLKSSLGASSAFAITAWQSTTVTITAATTNPTKGTIVTDKVYWRRVGDSMEVRIDYLQSTAGTGGLGTYLFTIPDGKTIDSTKCNIATSTAHLVGNGLISDNSSYTRTTTVSPYNTTKVFLIAVGDGIVGSGVRPMTAAQWQVGMTFVVPIVEWA